MFGILQQAAQAAETPTFVQLDNAMLAALITIVVAAIAAWFAAAATLLAAQASVVAGILDSYHLPEMMDGMHAILIFKDARDKKGEDWVKEFIELRKKNDVSIDRADHGRRRYQGYFYKVYQLRRQWRYYLFPMGVLPERLVRAVAWEDAVKFLREKVEPLDRAIKEGGYTRDMYDYFGKLYGIPAPPTTYASPRSSN